MAMPDLDTGAAAHDRSPLIINVASENDATAWEEFVRNSNDGTLHHELSFLAYHPRKRFDYHHLIVRQEAKIVAVVPGGLIKRDIGRVFVSPLGASVGGPIVTTPVLGDIIKVIEALQRHAKTHGWDGLEFVLGPSAYQRVVSDATSFALFLRGFKLIERDLSFIIRLEPGAIDAYRELFRKKQAWGVRAANRRGVRVAHGGMNLFDPFIRLFRETNERHSAIATHSEAEIADLLRRLPERVEITLAYTGDIPLAALLVFRLNDRAAQVFYICSSGAHARENATVTAMASLIDRIAATGARALDLGPSASSRGINDGVVFFKEGLGAVGQSRDRWAWEAN